MVGTIIKVISTGGGWRVLAESPSEVLSGELSKDAAVELGRNIARDRGGLLTVLSQDGTVELSEEYDWGVEPAKAGEAEITIPTVSVVQDDDGHWLVEGEHPDEILSFFNRKEDAIAFARPAAAARKAQLNVHLPDGDLEWAEDFAWAEGEQ